MGNGNQQINRREFIKKSVVSSSSIAFSGGAAFAQVGCDSSDKELEFDVIIKGGTVYDGTLSSPVQADVGIRGDKIIQIDRIAGKAGKVLDASGMAVVPGFIDVHTHCDLTFSRSDWKRYLAYVLPSWKGNYNYLYQGVTTVVTGNCGYGYTDLNTWFDILNSVEFGSNVYHLVPHGILRRELFGANQPVTLSSSQLEAMKKRLEAEMEKGAIGLSSGLVYAPGYLSSTSELIELAKVVRKYGGIYATHIRGESAKSVLGGFVVEKAIREAIEIGTKAELPVEISHLKITKPIYSQKASLVLSPIIEARDKGIPITADQYPYDAGSTNISDLLPNSFKTANGVKELYKTKEGRKSIKWAIANVFVDLKPEKIFITMYPEKEDYEGKNLKEIAEIENRDPAESYADMVCEDSNPVGLFFAQDMDIVREITPHDFIITGSDGWTVPKGMTHPHPRVYGTFPKKIKQFVFQEKILSFLEAIRSMTSLPAETFGMKGRGKLAKGYYADIAVLDLENLTDRATYFNPHQYSEGVKHLLVNGEISIEDGKAAGKRAGRALRA